jgi:hypothetical protein
MNTNAIVLCVLAAAMGVAGHVVTGSQFTGATRSQLHALACDTPAESNSPWNIRNLYDCKTSTLYIPYQLWTGAKWDGSKDGPCMHAAGPLIRGPVAWRNPETGATEVVWSRAKADGSNAQYFACHEKGIGQVYDSRERRLHAKGECNFPAGYGWGLSVKRECGETAVEITAITLNRRNELESIEFNTWDGATPDHLYRYAANIGLTDAWPR